MSNAGQLLELTGEFRKKFRQSRMVVSKLFDTIIDRRNEGSKIALNCAPHVEVGQNKQRTPIIHGQSSTILYASTRNVRSDMQKSSNLQFAHVACYGAVMPRKNYTLHHPRNSRAFSNGPSCKASPMSPL
jgi:hypothetical protein